MRKKSKNLSYKLVVSSSIFIFICIAILSLAERPIHNFEGKCSMCHLVSNDGKHIFEKIFVREIDFQCKSCHSNLGLSHPTGMKPTMAMPEGFPLNRRGRMTCATCHKTHGEKAYLLHKGEPGRVFCYFCHKDSLKNIHGGVGLGAHSTKKYEVVDKDIFVDELSAQCMSCHDSSLGKGVNIGAGTWLHEQGGSHPIGVDYRRAYSKGGFNPPSLLHKNIRLFKGRVGCGTCHDIYSKERNQLVITNKGSTLCLECHRK